MPKLFLSLTVLALLAVSMPLPAHGAELAQVECLGPDDPFCQSPLEPTNRIDEDVSCEECKLQGGVIQCVPVELEGIIGRSKCEVDKNGDCEDWGSFCEIIVILP